MKESIVIKNLGPIKDISIEQIKPITVLVWESGSWKSTLMKVISLFRWIYKMHNIRSYLKHSKISKSPFRFRMERYIVDAGLEAFINDNTEINYTVSFWNEKYTLSFLKWKLNGTTNSNLIKPNNLYYTKLGFIAETRSVIPLWNQVGSLSWWKLWFFFHEVFKDFKLSADNLDGKRLEVSHLWLKFFTKKSGGIKKYFIQGNDNNYEIELKNSSSGAQNSIPILLIAQHFSKAFEFNVAFNRAVLDIIADSNNIVKFQPITNLWDIPKKVYLHIEEPELSLFPDAQCQLIDDLIKECFVDKGNNMELMLSTHSPYVINYFNLLIERWEQKKKDNTTGRVNFDDVAVYEVEEGKLVDLKLKNKKLINTNILSDTINNIYNEYDKLKYVNNI